MPKTKEGKFKTKDPRMSRGDSLCPSSGPHGHWSLLGKTWWMHQGALEATARAFGPSLEAEGRRRGGSRCRGLRVGAAADRGLGCALGSGGHGPGSPAAALGRSPRDTRSKRRATRPRRCASRPASPTPSPETPTSPWPPGSTGSLSVRRCHTDTSPARRVLCCVTAIVVPSE